MAVLPYMPPVKYSIAVEKAAKLAQPKHMAFAPPARTHGNATAKGPAESAARGSIEHAQLPICEQGAVSLVCLVTLHKAAGATAWQHQLDLLEQACYHMMASKPGNAAEWVETRLHTRCNLIKVLQTDGCSTGSCHHQQMLPRCCHIRHASPAPPTWCCHESPSGTAC